MHHIPEPYVCPPGDGTGMVWDLPSGKREEVLEGHTREVHTVVLTQRGRFAVTASADSTARVWDLAAAPLAPPPAHGGKVTGLQVRHTARGN